MPAPARSLLFRCVSGADDGYFWSFQRPREGR
jgi:hypothetical protein